MYAELDPLELRNDAVLAVTGDWSECGEFGSKGFGSNLEAVCSG